MSDYNLNMYEIIAEFTDLLNRNNFTSKSLIWTEYGENLEEF